MSSHGNKSSRIVDESAAQVRIPDGDSDVDESLVGGRKSRVAGSSSGDSMEAGLRFPVLDRYRQVGEPIEGGMGVVYRALDVHLDIDVAIKRIRPKYAREAELIMRFEREAKVQVKLRHPHLVQVNDYSKDTHGPFIVMDWIDGRSLAEVIKQDGPMDWRTAALLISKVAMALQVAHEHNIIHRDVKPANILLDQKGEPFITDFGLARAEVSVDGASETNKDAVLGTMHFMSPEQMRNPKDVTSLSDLWSLGATLYQLLTTHDVLAMRERLIPEPLRDIVVQATERAPADRFGTMKLFAQALVHASNANADTKPAGAKPAPEEEDIADIWRKANERIEKAHAEAKAIAEKRQDYSEAVKILETVPEHLRKKKLYDALIRRRDRVVVLDANIRDSAAQMQSEGLREAINELLKLQPNREDLKKLLEQLPPEAPPEQQGPMQPPQAIRAPSPTPIPAPTQATTKKSVRPPLLVAPFDAKEAKASQEAWAKHLGIGVEITNSIGMKFRVIPPGTFEMGSPKSELHRNDNETLHKVTISQAKLLGVYLVTQAEWTKVMGSNPSRFTSVSGQDTCRFPVETVSWNDCQEFLDRMNESHAMKGWQYRLPTEAEWEYACRAGTVKSFWFGSELNGKQANCDGNYPYQTGKGPFLKRPSVIGSYGANPFGLYDQHGQVWEWCEDWNGAYAVGTSSQADPTGASSGSSRVVRGGSWDGNAIDCRSAGRGYSRPSNRRSRIGFRVVCELS